MAYAIRCRISVNISADILHSMKTFAALKTVKRRKKKKRIVLKDSFTAGKSSHWSLFHSHARQYPWKGLGIQKWLQGVFLQAVSMIDIN